MIDTHTHSRFSHDGCHRIETIVNKAEQLGIQYLAITDHCDWDYLNFAGYENLRQLDLLGYLTAMEEVKLQTKGLELAIGIELGYHHKASNKYQNEIPFERLDYVINSVHSINNQDVYFATLKEDNAQKEDYIKYLSAILESINAPYPYNTIGHIGYITRNPIYQSEIIKYNDFADLIDEILKGIINKDKTIELNSNIKSDISMPNKSIIKRYIELGGENVVFASDAHRTERLGDGYDTIKELALSLGIKYWTVYKRMQPKKITIT